MAEPAPLRRIAIDRGGTFTDVVAERSDGSVEVRGGMTMRRRRRRGG